MWFLSSGSSFPQVLVIMRNWFLSSSLWSARRCVSMGPLVLKIKLSTQLRFKQRRLAKLKSGMMHSRDETTSWKYPLTCKLRLFSTHNFAWSTRFCRHTSKIHNRLKSRLTSITSSHSEWQSDFVWVFETSQEIRGDTNHNTKLSRSFQINNR